MIKNKGFSLLELLVVVAIIGVLAAAGVVGYQSYTENAKNAVLDNKMSDTTKAIATDIAAIMQGLGETSEILEDVDTSVDVTCETVALSVVNHFNLNYQNQHQSSMPVAAYGNAAVEDSVGTFDSVTNSDLGTSIADMDRSGVIFVMCTNPADIVNNGSYRIYQCGCETSDCAFIGSDFGNPEHCPAPTVLSNSTEVFKGFY